MDMRQSDKHGYTPLPGKNQLELENKSTPLPDQDKQKYDNPPLTDKTKNCKSEGRTPA